MALISRFSRLFRADMHAVLDRIEEPVVLLKQAVREMEEDVSADERQLKLLEHELRNIPHLISDVETSLAAIQEEIQLCLDEANEQLARSVIKRKLESQHRIKGLQSRKQELRQGIAHLEERLLNNRTRLSAMKQKLEILQEETTSEQIVGNNYDANIIVTTDEIEVALLKEKQTRSAS